jgi:hypothetical protein
VKLDSAADPNKVSTLVQYISSQLPPGWPTASQPDGYPDSLGLCVIDAIWSMGVRYGGVENVLRRYRTYRGTAADHDSPGDLVEAIEQSGGPGAFSDLVKNHQRTSTKSGILKSQAVLEAARVLIEHGVHTCSDLQSLVITGDEIAVENQWISIRGQSSGISWSYFLMLAGIDGVKPDRMIRRFVARALGAKDIPAQEAAVLVNAAAKTLGTSATQLDHAIWFFERKPKKT